jgi:hypothetical protein
MENISQEDDLNDLRKDIIFKLQELKRRGALCGSLNALFQQVGFDSSNTYKALIAKVNKLESGDVQKQLQATATIVNQELLKHVQFYNKRAYFYSVSRSNLETLFKSLKNDNSLFKKGKDEYVEYNLSEDESIQTSLVVDTNDFKIIYLKSLRNRQETKRIDDKIPSIVEDENEKIIRLTKVVQYPMNAYDFVAFDLKNECLILGADLTSVFPKSETEKSIGNVLTNLRKLSRSVEIPSKSKDLRNCVENFEKEEIGDVLDHAFVTADGGYNHAGKSLTKGQDVRKDGFHKDGIEGKEADYYGVVKAYTPSNGEKDEKVIISIRLTYKEFKDKSSLPIRYAIFNGVRTLNGLTYSIRKVLEHNHK